MQSFSTQAADQPSTHVKKKKKLLKVDVPAKMRGTWKEKETFPPQNTSDGGRYSLIKVHEFNVAIIQASAIG